MTLRLGIDTGGTFTDAVIIDSGNNVVCHAKSLTTHYDLSLGIRDALDRLPRPQLQGVDLVGLSTTLTTNAVVEQRGMPVCVLLAGFSPEQVERSKLRSLIEDDPIVLLDGAHDPQGAESTPLDEGAAIRAIERHRDSVSAFAVSGMFGVRNPAHEVRLRDLVSEYSGKPVTCGHELSSALDAPRRALTAAVNARIIPFIRQLIEAVDEILEAYDIHAPLMVVKGDGSLINKHTALARPVETVMSGPAASVIGASFLSGVDNVLVADMGGTTTDIAVVQGGRPAVNPEGAIVGDWPLMIEAVEVHAIGLGGDSEVRYGGGVGIAIGPRRVVPLSLLAHQHPEILDRLERQTHFSANSRQNKFIMRFYENEVLLKGLNEEQRQAWELLGRGPVELEDIMTRDRRIARALAHLVRKGLGIYSGFTLTDAAHVLGYSNHWSQPAAEAAARIWAAQMKRVYGYGRWDMDDIEAACREVFDKLTLTICGKLIEAALPRRYTPARKETMDFARRLTSLILEADERERGLVSLSFLAQYRLVAVGAPVATYYPAVAERLNARLTIPEHAGVASAVGAVMGNVIQKAEIAITQPTQGGFRVHTHEGPRDFHDLSQAISFAEETAADLARTLARRAGARQVETVLSRQENRVDDALDGPVFFDATIRAVASGRPRAAE
ncbi:MAG: hydantoinase/oxoprolinase family protein [Arenicellales bacterium]